MLLVPGVQIFVESTELCRLPWFCPCKINLNFVDLSKFLKSFRRKDFLPQY